MAQAASRKRVSAIVPAYNEAGRIGAVLRTLTSYKKFREIIVVDDGSTDGTALVASRYDVQIIRTPFNVGKATSMDVGVKAASGDVIFFCDADIRGLTHAMIDKIVEPVERGETEMFIGMRNRKMYYVRQVLAVVPLLGGERALTRKLWERIPCEYKERFRIESALNFYARYCGRGFTYEVFAGLSQTIKEKKYGLIKGFRSRINMFRDLLIAQYLLQTTSDVHLNPNGLSHTARNLKKFLLGLAVSLSLVVFSSALWYTSDALLPESLGLSVLTLSMALVLGHAVLSYLFFRRWLTLTALRKSLYY